MEAFIDEIKSPNGTCTLFNDPSNVRKAITHLLNLSNDFQWLKIYLTLHIFHLKQL
jgi:hypothetical protein